MTITPPPPTEQPPIPMWLRVAQVVCVLLALVFITASVHQLVTQPTLGTGVWAMLSIGAAATWTALLAHGQQLRSNGERPATPDR